MPPAGGSGPFRIPKRTKSPQLGHGLVGVKGSCLARSAQSQCRDRVHSHGPACGEISRRQRHGRKQQRDRRKRQRIARVHAKQQRGASPPEPHGSREAKRKAREASVSASLITIPKMSLACAPMAMRKPISCVRVATAYWMSP